MTTDIAPDPVESASISSNISLLNIPTIPKRNHSSSLSLTTDPDVQKSSELSPSPQCNSTSESTSGPTTINSLPNELLVNIFDYFDIPPPSSSTAAIHDEPAFGLTNSNIKDLKNCSSVSNRWRQATLPLLFKHPRLCIPCDNGKIYLDTFVKPLNAFISEHSLSDIVRTFTLVVYKEEIYSSRGERKDYANFWRLVLSVIDPLELLIIAPVKALSSLTACPLTLADEWNIDSPCHYLRLQRPAAPVCDALPSPQPAEGSYRPGKEEFHRSQILQLRPWTALLLNEGSFIKAYSTYEFWIRKPPSILPALVGHSDVYGPRFQPLISPTVRSMRYISIFPTNAHFEALTQSFPRLDSLYVQLVPRNDILNNDSKMAQVDAEDLWMERNNCYATVMRELFSQPPTHNFLHLKEFESGDAADQDAWAMAVEYVKRADNGWKVAGEGVFIKDPNFSDPNTRNQPANAEAVSSMSVT